MHHWHLERKPLRPGAVAVHLFWIRVDATGAEHRVGVADRIVPYQVADALEDTLRAGVALLGGRLTTACDARQEPPWPGATSGTLPPRAGSRRR